MQDAKVDPPEALVMFLRAFGLPLTVICLKAGPHSLWLHASLTEAGFDSALVETRHVNAALSALTVQTDRRRALGSEVAPPTPLAIRARGASVRSRQSSPPAASCELQSHPGLPDRLNVTRLAPSVVR